MDTGVYARIRNSKVSKVVIHGCLLFQLFAEHPKWLKLPITYRETQEETAYILRAQNVVRHITL